MQDRKSSASVEGYYNRIRLHSGIGYRSPLEYEKHLENKIRRSKKRVLCADKLGSSALLVQLFPISCYI
ncbi:MAG: hypothetical protein ACR2MD_00255 [Aridibacter sp.]